MSALKAIFLSCALALPASNFQHDVRNSPDIQTVARPSFDDELKDLRDFIKKKIPGAEVTITIDGTHLKRNGWEKLPFTWREFEIWIKRPTVHDFKTWSRLAKFLNSGHTIGGGSDFGDVPKQRVKVDYEKLKLVPYDEKEWENFRLFVFYIAKSLRWGDSIAEVISQKVCLEVLKTFQRPELTIHNMSGYVRQIIHNVHVLTIQDAIRRRTHEPINEVRDEISSDPDYDNPENLFAQQEHRELLHSVIPSLNVRYRNILLLHFQGLDQAQIQEKMDITDTQYRLWLNRAKSQIREKIGNIGKRKRFESVVRSSA